MMSKTSRSIVAVVVSALFAAESSGQALAQANAKTAEGPPTRAEFTKLQNDVREQRELLIQMMQTEQQRYDMVLRLMQGEGGGTPVPGAASAPQGAGEAAAPPAAEKPSRKTAAAPERRAGTVQGKVTVTGGSLQDVYVYVENVRMPVSHRKVFEIRQVDRQFSPRVAVVQSGTSLMFPNMDSVYHNVFSNSPRNSFDLGTYQAGEKARSVTVTGPGVVEIYCNIHQRMSAKVLVVPSALYAKVRPDGTFRIDNVPPGMRRLVAWSPETKPQAQKVMVNGPTEVSFTLGHEESRAHMNKFGQAYGSYRD